MADFTPQGGNRAASGIIPPAHVLPQARPRNIKLYAKPAQDALQTLTRVHDRRTAPTHPTGGRLVPGNTIVSPFQHTPTPVLSQQFGRAPVLIPHPPGGDPALLTLDLQMTAAILGQFVVENAAGRTAMAHSAVQFVKTSHARHGMDALLLTALLHLESTHDAGFADALTVWRNTVSSAGSIESGDSGVVFDPQRQGLVSVDTPAFHDPFSGGVCLSQSVQHMQQLRGRDVGIGALGVAVVVGIIGAISGAVDAGQHGGGTGDVIAGAIGGFFNAIFQALGIDKYISFSTQDNKDDNNAFVNVTSNSDGTSVVINPNPGTSKSTGNKEQEEKEEEEEEKDNTKPDKPEDEQVPPPNPSGFPAPDDDGGSPWSLIAIGPLLTMSSARAMIAANTAPAFTMAQLPGLTQLHQAIDTRSPMLQQIGNLQSLATADPTRFSNIKQATALFNTQLGSILHTAPTLNAGLNLGIGTRTQR